MRRVIEAYKKAMLFSISHWKLTALMYSMNLLFAMLVLWPLNSIFSTLLAESRSAEELASAFNFNLFMDLFHQHPEFLGGYMNYVIMGLVLYFLWINFYKGGVIGFFSAGKNELSIFFSSGAKYFWKNLRLSIYAIVFFVLIVIIMYAYFSKDGLHVFDLESEVFLIDRFYFLLVILCVILFLSSIWTMIVRIKILGSDNKFLWGDMLYALRNFYKFPFVSLAILNLTFLLLLACVQMNILQSDALEKSSIGLILIVQLVVILRMILLVTRLGSFYNLLESES